MSFDAMWGRLLSQDALFFIVETAEKEAGEDGDKVIAFFENLKERVIDYKVIVVLATVWKSLNDTQQANQAVTHAGMYDASRFIILMDYLAMKFEKGELK
jgi:hypothetical protein